MYHHTTVAAVSALAGVWFLSKVWKQLTDGQRATPGRVARNLRKQGVPFNVAYALIFMAAPKEHIGSTVDVPVGSGPTTLDIII